jgi:hypothetical protein
MHTEAILHCVGVRIRRGLAAYDGAVVMGLIVLIVHDIARQRPISVADYLTVLVILSAVPQFVILIWSQRMTKQQSLEPSNPPIPIGLSLNRVEFWFLGGAIALAGGGMVQGFLAARQWFGRGGPGRPGPNCPWPLTNHGVYTCVDHSTYLAAGAGVQRFSAGVALLFFVVILLGTMSQARPGHTS